MQAAAEILGRRKGEQMAMLVHHSRNSVQKQWEETLVLALSGMAASCAPTCLSSSQ